MNGLILSTIIAAVMVTTAFYTTYSKNEELKAKVETSKSLLTAQKASTISGLKTTKLSDLAQNNLTSEQKVLLNNFQRAVNTAVIKNNITNPTCDNLASTGYITKQNCLEVKNKQNDYAKINNGTMQIDNKAQSKIITNVIAFKSTQANPTTQATTITPYTKRYMVHRFHIVKKDNNKANVEIENIAHQNNPNAIDKYAQIIIKKYDKSSKTTQKLNLINKLAMVSNRIKQIQDHKFVNTKIDKKDTLPNTSNTVKKYVFFAPTKTFVNTQINKNDTLPNNFNKVSLNTISQTQTQTQKTDEKQIASVIDMNNAVSSFSHQFNFIRR